MKIKNNEFKINKTSKYLFPILNFFGNEFVFYLNQTFKLGCGIFDYNFADFTLLDNEKSYIFILFNKEIKTNIFNKLLLFLQDKDYFVTYYTYGANLESPYVMIVLRLPSFFNDSYYFFLKGQYSKMYDKDIIQRLNFSEDVKEILLKTNKAKEDMLNILKNTFNVKLSKEDIIDNDLECDIPLILEEETFNCYCDNKFFNFKDKIW